MIKPVDPFFKGENLKIHATEVEILVKNREKGYFYEWTLPKFRNRLYLVRELLEVYYDSGEKKMPIQSEDPFWDPPTPVEVGSCLLRLENLGYLLDN